MGLFSGNKSSSASTSTVTNVDNRQVNTYTLDGGAISGMQAVSGAALGVAQAVAGSALGVANSLGGAAMDVAKSMGATSANNARDMLASGYDYADHIFDTAVDFANKDAGRAFDAFERAASITRDALIQVDRSAATTTATLQAAYADAKGTTDAQKQMLMAVIVVAGVIAVAALRNK